MEIRHTRIERNGKALTVDPLDMYLDDFINSQKESARVIIEETVIQSETTPHQKIDKILQTIEETETQYEHNVLTKNAAGVIINDADLNNMLDQLEQLITCCIDKPQNRDKTIRLAKIILDNYGRNKEWL